MKVQVFAVLKDFYEKEFEIEGAVGSITELSDILLRINPAAKEIVAISRFAVNNNFVDNDFQLMGHDNIQIIPPSSGG